VFSPVETRVDKPPLRVSRQLEGVGLIRTVMAKNFDLDQELSISLARKKLYTLIVARILDLLSSIQ
jgi:hypothetical protein